MDWGSCVINDVATLDCIPAVFQNVVNAALLFTGVIAVIIIILSGIRFITSGADAKKLETARHTLVFAILGLLLVLFSFLILNLIGYITGASCIQFFGFHNCG